MPKRSGFLRSTAAAAGWAVGIPALVAASPPPKPEKATITMGTAVESSSELPEYIGQTGPFANEGLTVKFLGFRGDAEVAQALAGDSIDISLASLNGLINLINAGQPVLAFYGGFNQADFSWLAAPALKRWGDLKGKTIGVSTFGSLTDALTRYVLRKHGLEPEKDVQIVQAGGSPSAIAALRAGKLQASILGPPQKWQAQDAGFTLLGTQAADVVPGWPKHVLMAKTSFINENPNTLLALLRAHVASIRLARRDRALAVKVMMDQLKYEDVYAQHAYVEAMPAFDERGNLPERSMPTFWRIAVQNGDVKEPWPDSKFFDKRYVDSFAKWAPPG